MSRIDPKNTYYFQHYNTLFMKVVPGDSVLESKDTFRNFLSSIYADKFGVYKQEGEWSSSIYTEVTKYGVEYYIRLTHEYGYFDLGKAPLEKLKRLSVENTWTYSKVFSIDEVRYNLDAIMRSGHAAPNYNPKKIERTLESVNYTFDINKLGYFKNYNTFVCVFSKYMNLDEFSKIINMVDNTLDKCISRQRSFLMTLRTDIDSTEEFYYITIKYEDKDPDGDSQWDIGYCWLSFLEEAIRGSSRTYSKPFFYYDIDTPSKLKNALEVKSDKPSYEPRKIDRTLEASGPGIYYNNQLDQNTKWPYRFKTRSELDDTCSKAGRYDWRCGTYLFIENMSFLFGRTLEYDFPDNEDYISIYQGTDSWFVTKPMLVKNEIATPSYTPRKINRLLERFKNKYKYGIIVVQVNSPQESIRIQQLCFDCGIEWAQGKILLYLDSRYLYIWLTDGQLTYSDNYRTDDFEEWNTDPKLYTINDYKSIKSIFQKGEIVPTYEPRKMDRTFEGKVEGYLYNHLAIRVMNETESKSVQEQLFDMGYKWMYGRPGYQDLKRYPQVIWVYSNKSISSSGFDTNEYTDQKIYEYIKSHNNHIINDVALDIFTPINTKNVDNILKYGKPGPSYTPRKVDRTLESVDTEHNYLPITIECNTNKDSLEFEVYLHKNGYNYVGGLTYVLRDRFNDLKHVVFFDLNPINKTTNLGGGTPKSYCDNNQKTLQYPADISTIDKYLGLKPSYTPKKINRDI